MRLFQHVRIPLISHATQISSKMVRTRKLIPHLLIPDFFGKRIPITDRTTGLVCEAQIFIAVLDVSNLTDAEPAWKVCPDGSAACACSASGERALACWLRPKSQERRAQDLVLRSRGQPLSWRHGCTLRWRHPASAALLPEGAKVEAAGAASLSLCDVERMRRRGDGLGRHRERTKWTVRPQRTPHPRREAMAAKFAKERL
jgi:hypothetical protein